MTKKTFSKVIAILCVAALMFGAVFTGAVSAADRTATCSVTGYKYSPGAVDVYVGYEVTFTSGTAFTAGSFTITPPSDLRFVDCTAKVSSQSGYVPKVYLNVSNNKVLFAGFEEDASEAITEFTSLTLVLKFTPTTAIKDAAAGKTWQITVGSISITNAAEETYTCSNAQGTAHVHNFGSVSSANGITTKTCSICSAVDKTITGDVTLTTNSLAATRKATLQFTADGDTVLCALVKKSDIDSLGGTTYFTYKYKDDTDDIKFATTTKSAETVRVDSIDYYVFPCGRNGGIGRMSRNITGNFINVPNSGNSTISTEWSYSIMSYLSTLISSGTTKEKNYAKALWNYGYYTTQRLEAQQDGFFDTELAAYGGTTYNDVTAWSLPSSKTASSSGSGSWTISGVTVETGYKPKMKFKLNAGGSVTVGVYKSDELVYKKTVTATSGEFFTISDIPTKYLTGDIKVKMSGSDKEITYSFGRYAKAREGKVDADVFLWMMRYSYYLGQAYA